jgi:hypothetical protein
MILVDGRRRALHDRLVHSVVVYAAAPHMASPQSGDVRVRVRA